MQKTVVIIPTYNESQNIEKLLMGILNLNGNISIVVVDDNSSDGTGKIVKNLMKTNSRIHLISRQGKRTEGIARKEGYRYALSSSADFILEMDADFSHHPKYILKFLKEIKNADIVIGSRYVKGGKETGRTKFRIFLSLFANFYIKTIYGIKQIYDCTSGFRCFRKEVFMCVELDKLKAKGPAIIPELLYHLKNRNFNVKEMPICYEARKNGKSKLNFSKIAESLILPMLLKFKILK